MFPWLWLWFPQYHLFNQNVQPQTDWTFGNISPRAGDAATERRIHQDVASYGRQLGLLTEVLLPLAGDQSITPEQARESLARLQAIRAEVEQLKGCEPGAQQQALAALQRLAEQDPDACASLLRSFALAHPRLAAPAGKG